MSEIEIIIVACCIVLIGSYGVLAWANIRLQKICRNLLRTNTELMDALKAHTNLNQVLCQQRDDALDLVRWWEERGGEPPSRPTIQ